MKEAPALEYGFTTEEHWHFFAEFCRYDRLAGGPDPHMACVGEMSRGLSDWEKIWRAGCYIGVYNVPTAEVLWSNLRPDSTPGVLESFIRQNWGGLSFRRERRAVRTVAKLTAYLVSYQRWMHNRATWWDGLMGEEEAYEAAWRDVRRVYGLGRYVALKLLEFLQRYCEAPISLPDMRPSGGWSPRAALALLHPEYEGPLRDTSPRYDRLANDRFEQARRRLANDFEVPLDRYNMQVLLCDYKQSVIGRRQYPGRSQDSELAHGRKVFTYFGPETAMWDARAAIFPHWALGELNGWDDVRGALGTVLAEHHYTWSDSVYDWHRSKGNLGCPVAS